MQDLADDEEQEIEPAYDEYIAELIEDDAPDEERNASSQLLDEELLEIDDDIGEGATSACIQGESHHLPSTQEHRTAANEPAMIASKPRFSR